MGCIWLSMRELLAEVSRLHFPNAPATPQEIEQFEQRVGWQLDPDLRAFYTHCNGADLFKRPNSPYRLLPLSKIVRARVAILGEDSDEWGPAGLYTLCDVQDGNYVLIDTGTRHAERYQLIDGNREAFPDPDYCRPVAESFHEFLSEALHSNGRPLYWLSDS